MQSRGPVFVTSFNPLCMIIVTALGSFLLGEHLYLGRYLTISGCFFFPVLPKLLPTLLAFKMFILEAIVVTILLLWA